MYPDIFLERLESAQQTITDLLEMIKNDQTEAFVPLTAEKTSHITVNAKGIASGHGDIAIDYQGSASCPYGKSATKNKQSFDAIVLHHTGPHKPTEWYVQYQIQGDRERGGHFGYHFYIARDGHIVQGAPLTKRTNHVKPSHSSKRNPLGKHANNTNAIGISCVGAGQATFSPTNEQLRTLETLVPAIANHYAIPFDHIYGHGELQRDRMPTEGTFVAKEFRKITSLTETLAEFETPLDDDIDDDTDDGVVHSLEHEAMMPSIHMDRWETDFPQSTYVTDEDDDDRSIDAISSDLAMPLQAAQHLVAGYDATQLKYTNQSAIRNQACTNDLIAKLIEAVEAVYGVGCSINIYSGGQDRKGQGSRRTGSIRHDNYGQGGRAADIHVFDTQGRQIKGLKLAALGQYWLAAGFGCVGHEMKNGGIHLDEWTTPPPGGQRYWTYAASEEQSWGKAAKALLVKGAAGIYP